MRVDLQQTIKRSQEALRQADLLGADKAALWSGDVWALVSVLNDYLKAQPNSVAHPVKLHRYVPDKFKSGEPKP